MPQIEADRLLVRELQKQVFDHDPAWSCQGRDGRPAAHGLIQYPAMMVPAMQRDILQAVSAASQKVELVMDPFVGSGTVLTESIAAGKAFIGFDINPLAILISRVKKGPFDGDLLAEAAERVSLRVGSDRGRSYAANFPNQKKWFRKSNSIGLSRIRRAIEAEPDLYARRFFWVAVAETIRRCSNSRTSTYKLHIREEKQIEALDAVALPIFQQVMAENVRRMAEEQARLKASGILRGSRYNKSVDVQLSDICGAQESYVVKDTVDLVITSPPYGDNKTTVPYGQFSYLALQWIPLCDIDPNIDEEILSTTHFIDGQSVGGSLRINQQDLEELNAVSPAFRRFYSDVSAVDANGAKRWAAFSRDLYRAMATITMTVRQDGYLAWVVGERRICDMTVPLVEVLADFHNAVGAEPVRFFPRTIHTKRMPMRNGHSDLMQSEHVCFFRKSAVAGRSH